MGLGPRWVALLVGVLVALGSESAVGQSAMGESRQESSRQTEPDAAEKNSGRPEDYFGNAHRRQLYEESKLEYSRAALWTALLPGLGNFYAEQYLIGGLNASLVGFTALLVPYGLVTDQLSFVWTGIGITGTAYVSGFTTSLIGVRNYNRRLRRSLDVPEEPRAGAVPRNSARAAPGISIGFRF